MRRVVIVVLLLVLGVSLASSANALSLNETRVLEVEPSRAAEPLDGNLCRTETVRSTQAAIVPLRSQNMPTLPGHGIWIVPGESLCVLASPGFPESERRSDEKALAELFVLTSGTAPTLRVSLERAEDDVLDLSVENLSIYVITFEVGFERRLEIRPGRAARVRVLRDVPGVLISRLWRRPASNYERQSATPVSEARQVRQQQAWWGFTAFAYTRYSKLDALYETLTPLGYDRPGNSWLAPGGSLFIAAERFIVSFDLAMSGRGMKLPDGSQLATQHGEYGVRAGYAAYADDLLQVSPILGIGTEYYELKFSESTLNLPQWTDGYRKPTFARIVGSVGVMSEVVVRRSTNTVVFLRAESGARVQLGRGRWQATIEEVSDQEREGKAAGASKRLYGPRIGSHSPYGLFSVGMRFGVH